MKAIVGGWNNLPGDSKMKRFKNVIMDCTLTPLIGGMFCIKQAFFNPNKYIESNGNGGAIGRYGQFVTDNTDSSVTFEFNKKLDITKHICGPSALIGSIDNFGHYIINDLPRLVEASKFAGEFENFIIGPAPSYVLEFMSHLGVDPKKATAIGPDDLALIEDLTIFPLQCYSGFRDQALNVSDSFPDAMRERCALISESPSRRLYFPRGHTRWRRIVNEDAVIALMTDLGFEVYVPEQHAIAEQLAAVGAAEIIVCPFGASAQIGMFAPTGSSLVWIEPPSGQNRIAKWGDLGVSLAGVRLYRVIGSKTAADDLRPEDADYCVDLIKLRKVIEMALLGEPGWRRTLRRAGDTKTYTMPQCF